MKVLVRVFYVQGGELNETFVDVEAYTYKGAEQIVRNMFAGEDIHITISITTALITQAEKETKAEEALTAFTSFSRGKAEA